MSGDDPKTLEYPNAELSPEERARRLKVEVDRLANLPVVEWQLYLEDVAKKYGVSRADLKSMVEATIRANEKKRARTRLWIGSAYSASRRTSLRPNAS